MNEIKNLLETEIQSELKELGKIQLGTNQYETTVNNVCKLLDKVNDREKIQLDYQSKKEAQLAEFQLKSEEIKMDRKDRIVKNCLTGIGIVTSLGLTIWGALKSWEFEKEGTVTSSFGKMFMNNFRPKK